MSVRLCFGIHKPHWILIIPKEQPICTTSILRPEHQVIVEAFKKIEQLARISAHTVSAEGDHKIRQGVEELQMLHLKFRNLITELDNCTKRYEEKRKAVQSVMYKSIRKMNTELKRKHQYRYNRINTIFFINYYRNN